MGYIMALQIPLGGMLDVSEVLNYVREKRMLRLQ